LLESIVSGDAGGVFKGDPAAPLDPLRTIPLPHVREPAHPNLADLLTCRAEAAPDDMALMQGATSFSFREYEALVWGLCRRFRDAGLGQGAVVGLRVGNPALHLAALLALARIGAVSVPVSASAAEAGDSQSILERTGATAVVDAEAGAGRGESLREIRLDAESALSLRADPDPALRGTPASDLLMFKTSSGTTGAPKIVAATHSGMALSIEREIASIGYPRRERYLTPVSLRFDAPRRRYLACLAAGGTCVMPTGEASAATVAARIEEADVRHFSCVASFAHDMAALPHPAQPRFPRMRCFRLSAGPAAESLIAQVRERLTPNVWVSYGCSELGPLTVADPQLLARHPGSVGRPMPGIEVDVAGGSGESLPHGSPGTLRLRARGMPDRYHGDEGATSRHFRGGWFLPGDHGKLTPDGVLFLLGRTDDMMILDGMNIYPSEIEKVMLSHPRVTECAAFPLKHRVLHHVPACAVVLGDGEPVPEEALLAHARARLGLRAPQFVVVLEAMPRNEHGKIARAPLLRAVAERLRAIGVRLQ
jgi:acyl-coenzyme A synthetase/AMP-(fatty) acid ligase